MLFQESAAPSLWESARDMNLLHERLNKLFSNLQETKQTEFPPINVWTSEEKCLVIAEVPGIDLDNIDLQIVNNILTLKTKREPDQSDERKTWHRRERGCGQFTRSLELPYAVDAEKVQAVISHGVLRIELLRAAEDSPKKISIQAS